MIATTTSEPNGQQPGRETSDLLQSGNLPSHSVESVIELEDVLSVSHSNISDGTTYGQIIPLWDDSSPTSSVTLPRVDYSRRRTSEVQSVSSNLELISRARSIKTLIHLRHGNPASKHAASLTRHIISSYPQMMLRRQTFPPFIHACWHLPQLPEKIASCMSIAQLFSARTPETRQFVWRTIYAEMQRFLDLVRLVPIVLSLSRN